MPISPKAAQHAALLDESQAFARAHAAGEVAGLFGPDSVLWRVMRETLLLAGGGRALVLELARPEIAQGIEDNSRFRNNLIARARRTFAMIYGVFFGDLEHALALGRAIHAGHQHVWGRISARTHPGREGEQYFANDPLNLAWVLCTQAESVVLTHEALVGPLGQAERDQLLWDFRTAGAAMGAPPAAFPRSWVSMTRWIAAEADSPALHVGATLREQCHDLFNAPATAGSWDEVIALGSLPERLRPAVPRTWGRRSWLHRRLVLAEIRALRSSLPDALRWCPAWHQAQIRVHGRGAPLSSRLVARIDRQVDLPFSL